MAIRFAWLAASRFPDGQLYVNLHGFDPVTAAMPPGTALRGFFDALGVPSRRVPQDIEAQSALLRSLLDGRRMLVVLNVGKGLAKLSDAVGVVGVAMGHEDVRQITTMLLDPVNEALVLIDGEEGVDQHGVFVVVDQGRGARDPTPVVVLPCRHVPHQPPPAHDQSVVVDLKHRHLVPWDTNAFAECQMTARLTRCG